MQALSLSPARRRIRSSTRAEIPTIVDEIIQLLEPFAQTIVVETEWVSGGRSATL